MIVPNYRVAVRLDKYLGHVLCSEVNEERNGEGKMTETTRTREIVHCVVSFSLFYDFEILSLIHTHTHTHTHFIGFLATTRTASLALP